MPRICPISTMSKFCFLLFFCLSAMAMTAQTYVGKTTIDGVNVTMQVDKKKGDTLFIAEDLMTFTYTSPRKFATQEEYNLYRKYMRYAAVVYPYAQKAVIIFKELEEETGDLKKGKRKKAAKQLQKQLDDEFEAPLKNLTRTQGKILVKMIEKELDTPIYSLIKNYRGGVTATYWNSLSKIWGYDLKEGYREGDDPIMDAVLQDFLMAQPSGAQ